MIKGLIFDKDGTLFDFTATWGGWTQRIISQQSKGDIAIADRLATALRFDRTTGCFEVGSAVIAGTVDDVVDAILTVLTSADRDSVIENLIAEANEVNPVEVIPLEPYFQQLRGLNLQLGVATNDAEYSARLHLEDCKIVRYFDFIAGYDSGFSAKPEPGQLQEFCRRTNLDPDECVMVGDSLHDLHAGRAAGMMTVGVLTGPAKPEELAPIADVILPTINEIPDWLRTEGLI